MKTIIRAARAAALAIPAALATSAAQAHHSFAMFDRDREVVLTGTVKEFQWTNPHTWLQLNVPNAQGAATEWSIEGLSTGTLSRQGWKPRSFKPGDKVTVKIYPMKDGSSGGSFIGATLPNGSTLGKM